MRRIGKVAGIPYDSRRPTMARFKNTYSSADNPEFFPPKVDGIGWGINFYWVVHPLRWLTARKAAHPIPSTSGGSNATSTSGQDST